MSSRNPFRCWGIASFVCSVRCLENHFHKYLSCSYPCGTTQCRVTSKTSIWGSGIFDPRPSFGHQNSILFGTCYYAQRIDLPVSTIAFSSFYGSWKIILCFEKKSSFKLSHFTGLTPILGCSLKWFASMKKESIIWMNWTISET